jgi:ferredoxin
MRVTVDQSRCQGHALCAMHAPGLFDLDAEGHSVVVADPVPGGLGEAAYTAEAGCPEEAITVEPRRLAHAGQARS